MAVAHIIHEYEICKAPETPEKLEFVGKNIVLNPKGGIPLLLKRVSTDAAVNV